MISLSLSFSLSLSLSLSSLYTMMIVQRRARLTSSQIQRFVLHKFPNVVARDGENGERWSKRGLEAIRAGKVAVVVLAGGQGTRLGCTIPKGMFLLNSLSGTCLFQLHAERLQKLANLAASCG